MRYFHTGTIESQEEARQLAIDWQNWQADQALSLAELSDMHGVFVGLADRWDLVEEFEENGVI